jgi:flagellar hook-basal body complex protein FliE
MDSLSGSLPFKSLPQGTFGVDTATSVLPGLEGNSGPGQVLQGFGDMLSQQLQSVSQLQQSTDQQVQAYAAGADIPLHQIMIGMEKAGTAMDLALQVRNKLVGAYQELSRMQF